MVAITKAIRAEAYCRSRAINDASCEFRRHHLRLQRPKSRQKSSHYSADFPSSSLASQSLPHPLLSEDQGARNLHICCCVLSPAFFLFALAHVSSPLVIVCLTENSGWRHNAKTHVHESHC